MIMKVLGDIMLHNRESKESSKYSASVKQENFDNKMIPLLLSLEIYPQLSFYLWNHPICFK